MKKIIIDAGHGGSDPGANGFGVNEKDWTLKMSVYQFKRLTELGVQVDITRMKDKSLDSVTRSNLIKNKYNLCISNHFNAFNSKARGIETIHSIHGNDEFATDLANELVKATNLPLRRVFTRKDGHQDYYFMHRLTGTTETVIIEYGFIDNKEDHDFYKNEANFIDAAEAVIKVICEHVDIPYQSPVQKKPVPKTDGKLYKVQTGAFGEKENAEKLVTQLKKDGYSSYVVYE